MAKSYSTYEAKARFSEILRKVRAGKSVTISYRGREVAEIRPIYDAGDVSRALLEMEEEGVVSRSAAPAGRLEPIVNKPGSLQRFLESRE
jgi:prevent-host-death family protein